MIVGGSYFFWFNYVIVCVYVLVELIVLVEFGVVLYSFEIDVLL